MREISLLPLPPRELSLRARYSLARGEHLVLVAADRAHVLEHARDERRAAAAERVEHEPARGVTRRTSQRMSAIGFTVRCRFSTWPLCVRSERDAFAV